MLPILLISDNSRLVKKYLADFIEKNKIPSYAILQIEKEKTAITIDQIRAVNISLSRGIGINRLVIIDDFQTTRGEAQNAFLKTLEEKTDDTFFILVCTRQSTILPTIISRCRIVKVTHQKKIADESSKSLTSVEMWHQYSGLERKKDKAVMVCDQLIDHFRDLLIKKPGTAATLREILKTRSLIETNNLNPQLGVDHLAIIIDKQTHAI